MCTWHEYVSLCVREAKQSAQRKHSYGSPLVSIAEREETECREGLEPDATERTANSPNSTDKTEVHRITVCWEQNLFLHSAFMCIEHLLSILLFHVES